MTAANFKACLEHVFASEGGYVDHPKDPGGATNMGITISTLSAWRGSPASKADVRNLTRDEAAKIYRANYWNPVRGDDLPAGLDLVAFDAAVNSGVSRGAAWLQKALGVPADGKIGPQTITAANTALLSEAIRHACENRLTFLRGLSTWSTFGKGWASRVSRVQTEALAMAAKPSATKPGLWAAISAAWAAIIGAFRK